MNKLKQHWQVLSGRIDALTLRERAMIFAAVAVTLLALINLLVLDPVMARQKKLAQQVKLHQAKIKEAQANMQLLAAAQGVDPDQANKARLALIKRQIEAMNARLENVQQSLVPPNKMSAVLEDILRRDRQLQLVSLKTLPVAGLDEMMPPPVLPAPNAIAAATPAGAQPAAKPAAPSAIYRHGVEITVQGSYAELLGYLAQLEALPWRMYWGKASLAVGDYPAARLTLTLYTMSLDKAWLSI